MRAVWVFTAIVCAVMVNYTTGHKRGGDNCCNGNKILDTIQRVMAYGGHKGHKGHHNRHFTAFTAYLGSSITASQSSQRVVFDKVVTNYGNAYNNKDGVFTSPADGVYMFDNNVLSQNSKSAYTRMIVNSKVMPFASYGHSVSGSHATATLSGVLQLKKGDRVWISTFRKYNLHSVYSTFSGWLLHEI